MYHLTPEFYIRPFKFITGLSGGKGSWERQLVNKETKVTARTKDQSCRKDSSASVVRDIREVVLT
jgi:hypothetical protein